jgi:hypothetical protein
MLRRFRPAICSLIALVALSATVAFAADATKLAEKSDGAKATPAESPKVIKPEEAKDHLDKVVTVEFTVAKSRELLDKNIAFLNSEKDLKSPTNFTGFIKNAKKFKEAAKIEKPAEHYLKKKVRVTGKVVKYQEKLEIEILSPDQIQIVEEERKADTETSKSSSTN